jgi:hypothetical protein
MLQSPLSRRSLLDQEFQKVPLRRLLDGHWRNARTHTLHDPVRYQYVSVGNYYLNDVLPPRHGAI